MKRAPRLFRPYFRLSWKLAISLGGAVLFSALLGGALGPRTADASIILAMDLPELVRRADHIAVVDVMAERAAWDAKHERIYSTVDLKVVERWKGSPAANATGSDHLTIVQPGGTVGDITMTVTGLSSFTPGERALVFLHGQVDHAQLVGMTQGKRSVRFEATSGRWMVHPPNLRQATLVRPPAAAPAPPPSSSLPPPPPSTSAPTAGLREAALDDFRSEVKALVEAAPR
jgi:hypothetical protein